MAFNFSNSKHLLLLSYSNIILLIISLSFCFFRSFHSHKCSLLLSLTNIPFPYVSRPLCLFVLPTIWCIISTATLFASCYFMIRFSCREAESRSPPPRIIRSRSIDSAGAEDETIWRKEPLKPIGDPEWPEPPGNKRNKIIENIFWTAWYGSG